MKYTKNTKTADQPDVLKKITDQIVAAIEAGTDSYTMPWNCRGADSAMPVNASSRKPYRGMNVLTLWGAAEEKGYDSNVWATYKQWEEMGAQVRKGEKSTWITFWKFWTKDGDEAPELKDAKEQKFAMARGYAVFNAAQVDGYELPALPPSTAGERLAHAEEFFQSTGAVINHGGNRAYYRPSTDSIQMPPFERFKKTEFYYSTLAHETGHWTGAPARLNRDMKGRFGDNSYAMEELVAELTAAFTCATLGIETEPRTDHAPYIANWLKVLKSDKRAIFTAASKAQQATDYLFQWKAEAEQPEGMAA